MEYYNREKIIFIFFLLMGVILYINISRILNYEVKKVNKKWK